MLCDKQEPAYHVFISYRREDGSQLALLLQECLQKYGLRVFIDRNLGSGPFDKETLRHISESPTFLIILTPKALERCVDKKDWLRREIVHAMSTKRNILPLLVDSFDFTPEVIGNLDLAIRKLSAYQAVRYSPDFLEATVERIVKMIGDYQAKQRRREKRSILRACVGVILAALITAVGSIIVGFVIYLLAAMVIAAIIEAVIALIEIASAIPTSLRFRFLTRFCERLFRSRTLEYIASIVLVLALSDFTPIRVGETIRTIVLGLPTQERMISEVLASYNRGDFQGAINEAKRIVQEYEFSAKSEQQQLMNASPEQWPPGKVPLGKSWKAMKVFERGSLNSVALAWWIQGRSEQMLGHDCQAKDAFEAAAQYSYARSWDPQSWPIRGWSPYGWFWSPPDDARHRAQFIVCENA